MAILHIKNKETWERIWIDARFSNTGTAFDELKPVEGFPKWVYKDDEFDIDMSDWKELLYRRSLTTVDQSDMSDLYRIRMHGRSNVVTDYIWATQLEQPLDHIEHRFDMPHWFMDNSSVIPSFLTKKCGVDEKQIEQVRSEIRRGAIQTKLLLSAKVRTTQRYLIEPHLKIGGYDGSHRSTCQVFVTLTDCRTGIAGTKLIIESNAYEALSLIESFVIKKGNLEGKPRNTKYGYGFCESYRSRGFRVPVSEPINNFFLLGNVAKDNH